MRHAMDDNGIPSKEIHERHRERAITAEEAPDDTKPLQYVLNLKRPMNRGTELPLNPKRLTPLNGKTFRNNTSPTETLRVTVMLIQHNSLSRSKPLSASSSKQPLLIVISISSVPSITRSPTSSQQIGATTFTTIQKLRKGAAL
ncbi:hypothetical protein Tco_0926536 [Tanacetum coccineum]|uniref:Uncharacterized protein n=1 Tax=Tanacetum coccineum TaxID=301880 RepID=A0ABQ5DAW5_9ASTR